MIWIFICLSLVWLAITAICLIGLRCIHDLPALSQPPSSATISVVVPARDEVDRVETTVCRLLAQADVEMELVFIDDRSTDGTGDVLERLRKEHDQMQVLSVETLPAGWLGKCHACHVGAQATTGEWLLFADADSWMAPDLLARAIQTAERDGVEHLCIVPALHGTTWIGRAIVLAMTLGLVKEAEGVNRGRAGAYMGLGAFNLVRRAAYDAIGGHEPLRMEVVDDIRLGFLLERHGFATRIYFALAELEVAWIRNLFGFYKIIEKNYFAVLGFSTIRLCAVASAGIALWCGTVLAPWFDPIWGWLPLISLFTPSIPAAIIAPGYGWSRWSALAMPLAFPIIISGMVYSGVKTLAQGGIRWRDSFYGLRDLRAGLVR